MTSSKCSSLNVPFVSIFVKIADNNDVVTSHSFELTIPEFNVCSHTLLLCVCMLVMQSTKRDF